MQQLNRQWNLYVQGLWGVDTSQSVFQVVTGEPPPGCEGDARLYWFADQVPSDSSTGGYDRYGITSSQAYSELLFSLLPQDGGELRAVLSEGYSDWVRYRSQYYSGSLGQKVLDQDALFRKWAARSLSPKVARHAISVFTQAQLTSFNLAIDALADPSARIFCPDETGRQMPLFRYSGSAQAVQSVFASSDPVGHFAFDSGEIAQRASHAWADERERGFSRLWRCRDLSQDKNIQAKAEGARVTVHGRLGRVAQIETAPLGWFDPRMVKMAYRHPGDHRIWDVRGRYDWQSLFAQPDGALSRFVSSLVLVEEGRFTLTVHAPFTRAEFEAISASAGLPWPLLQVHDNRAVECRYRQDLDGSISCDFVARPGYQHVWGLTYRALAYS